jgi:PilZ domain
MDHRKEMRDSLAAPNRGNRSEHLRALKRDNENQADRLPSGSSPSQTSGASAATGAVLAAEKRKHPRYKSEGSAEFRTNGTDMRTWATIADMSLSGCYVELAATSAVNTSVTLVLDVKEIRVSLKGVVRTSYPLLGMGIEFAEIPNQEMPRLEEILRRLSNDSAASDLESSPPHPSVPDMLMIMDAGAALRAVARFFQNNQTLSLEQFKDLIGKSQDREPSERR